MFQGIFPSYSLSMSPIIKFCNLVYLVFIFACLSSFSNCLKIIPEGTQEVRWVNESFVLTCLEEGDMTDRRLEWTQGGVTDPSFVLRPQSNGHQLQLLVYFAKKSNAGEYTCNLKDTRSNQVIETKSITMNIFDRIQFIGQQNREVLENQNAELVCKFSYDEMLKVSVSWLRNSIEQLNGSSNKYRISNSEGRPYTSILTISQVKKEDAGSYTCQVLVNSLRKTDIKFFQLGLNVVYGPKFMKNESDTGWIDEKKFMNREVRDKQVILRCSVDANPKARIAWQLASNRALSNDSINYTHVIKDGDNFSELRLSYKTTTASNKNRPIKDKTITPNEFRCDASNQFGEDSRRYYVKISKLPKMPDILEYNMANNLLTIQIKEQKIIPPIDKYRVRIHNKDFEFNSNLDNNQTYTVQIDNVPGGDHAFRLFAHNPVGWSEPLSNEAMKLLINFSSSLSPQIHIFIILFAVSLSTRVFPSV